MKKSSLKSSTFALTLSMGITPLALPSCKSMSSIPIVESADSTTFIQKNEIHNSEFIIQNSHVHDSIVYREKVVHDTVFITKEVYRDALNSKFKIQNSTQLDTVRIVEWRERVVQKPPERYVPKFYRWCTIALWGIIAIYLAVIGFRLRRKISGLK